MNKLKELARDSGFWLSRKINYPLVSPDTLQISLTSKCNLRCRMCSIWEQAVKKDELTLDEIKSAINQGQEWGIKEINLCGGEPLLGEFCFDAIDYSKRHNMKVILTTNGTLINENLAKRIINSKLDVITISLDGASAQTHDKIRGQPGAYDLIINGIKHLNNFRKESKLVKVLILTISNDNLDELEDYLSLAKSLLIDALYLTSLVQDNVKLYSQDNQSNQNDMWIKGERLLKLDKIIDKISILQRHQYHLNYPSFPLIKKYFRRKLAEKDWVCFAGFRRFVVIPEGSIQMCGEAIGNIRQVSSLRKIWVSEEARKKRIKIKKCRNYCLQDCHARQESSSLKNIFQSCFKKNK